MNANRPIATTPFLLSDGWNQDDLAVLTWLYDATKHPGTYAGTWAGGLLRRWAGMEGVRE